MARMRTTRSTPSTASRATTSTSSPAALSTLALATHPCASSPSCLTICRSLRDQTVSLEYPLLYIKLSSSPLFLFFSFHSLCLHLITWSSHLSPPLSRKKSTRNNKNPQSRTSFCSLRCWLLLTRLLSSRLSCTPPRPRAMWQLSCTCSRSSVPRSCAWNDGLVMNGPAEQRSPQLTSTVGKTKAVDGQTQTLRRVVEINVLNAAGRAPIHVAASRGHKGVVKLLVEQGT